MSKVQAFLDVPCYTPLINQGINKLIQSKIRWIVLIQKYVRAYPAWVVQ